MFKTVFCATACLSKQNQCMYMLHYSAWNCQFSPAGQSLIQPLLKPFEACRSLSALVNWNKNKIVFYSSKRPHFRAKRDLQGAWVTNTGTATKTFQNWIPAASNFIALSSISFNSSNVGKLLRSSVNSKRLYRSGRAKKRQRNPLSCVQVLHKTWN